VGLRPGFAASHGLPRPLRGLVGRGYSQTPRTGLRRSPSAMQIRYCTRKAPVCPVCSVFRTPQRSVRLPPPAAQRAPPGLESRLQAVLSGRHPETGHGASPGPDPGAWAQTEPMIFRDRPGRRGCDRDWRSPARAAADKRRGGPLRGRPRSHRRLPGPAFGFRLQPVFTAKAPSRWTSCHQRSHLV
jgi:hypothetical protein